MYATYEFLNDFVPKKTQNILLYLVRTNYVRSCYISGFNSIVSIGFRLRHPDVFGARWAHVSAGMVLELSDEILKVADADGSTLWRLIFLVIVALAAKFSFVDFLSRGRSLSLIVLIFLQGSQVARADRDAACTRSTLGRRSL